MKFKNLNNFITKIPGNYLAEMAKKNVAFIGNCKDLYTYFQKINKNCKYFSITKQNWKSVVKSLTKKDNCFQKQLKAKRIIKASYKIGF